MYILIIFVIFGCLQNIQAEKGHALGCYQDIIRANETEKKIINLFSSETPNACIVQCERSYFRFATLRSSEECTCRNIKEEYKVDDKNCDKPCKGNATQQCGGNDSTHISVYETGINVPGPPLNVKAENITGTTLVLQWSAPVWQSGVLGYIIFGNVVHSYATLTQATPQWHVSKDTEHMDVFNLHPGTQYNFTVRAQSLKGPGFPSSVMVTTLIGEPDPSPKEPVIIERTDKTIQLKLTPSINDNGPISAYRLVVVNEDLMQGFMPELLKSYKEAQSEGLSYYIAAEIEPFDTERQFTIGDGKSYNSFFNAPLSPHSDIHVILGVVSRSGGIERIRYTLSSHSQHGIVILNHNSSSRHSSIIIGLSIAIALSGILLLFSIIAFFFLRYRVQNRRRRIPDCQELSIQGPILEVDNIGYLPEDEIERVDHYENLKEKVWNIPKNFLDFKSQKLIGSGTYGRITSGIVVQNSQRVPVAVYNIQDADMERENKKNMLRELNTLILAGKHQNIVSLVGLYETAEALLVVLQPRHESLKTVLIKSRALTLHSVTTLSETGLLQIALQIALAMQYLSQKKIIHKKLCSHNVSVDSQLNVKVTGHGLSDYSVAQFSPDYTRWTAHEIFRQRPYHTKSDIWSYGCLLWEIITFGGTPYSLLPTSIIPTEVIRGTRLKSLPYVGDDLHQLMIFCWQLDLEERPTFEEIIQSFQTMIADTSIVKINLTPEPNFTYEQYKPELEQKD